MAERPDLQGALQGLSPRQRELLLRRLGKEGAAPSGATDGPVRRERRAAGEESFPLSVAQERIWFLERLTPGSAVYNVPAVIEARGALELAALEGALRAVVARHEALRTTFRSAAAPGRSGPEQVVRPTAPLPFEVADLRPLPPPEREAEAGRRTGEEIRRPFDLERGPLLRVLVLALEEERHRVVLTLHHIASDGWSMGVLVREIGALYPLLAAGEGAEGAALPALPIQYGDYALWQRERLAGPALAAELDAWRERLAGAPTVLALPADRPRPAVATAEGFQVPFELPAPVAGALRALARERGCTLFALLFAAYAAILHRLSGQESLLVGAPVAGRNRRETEGLIGLFVNTLVLRSDLPAPAGAEGGGPTLADWIERARGTALAMQGHQEIPFERLVEALGVERDLSRAPLVQAAFSLQRREVEGLRLPGLELLPREADTGTAKFELMAFLTEGRESVSGWLEASSALFDRTTIVRFAERLAALLGAFASGLDATAVRLGDLPFLLPAERHALLAGEWTDAPHDPPSSAGLLHTLFASAAARSPARLAVVAEDGSLTYGELDRRSNALAHRLRARGVGPEERVGLCLAKSARRTVALLAVLKAGGAYVPLDPTYPPAQLRTMLEDSGARLVLSESALADLVADGPARIWLLDPEGAGGGGEAAGDDGSADSPPEELALPANLAYVIYTSGSTGVPKGVAVPHGGVCGVVLETARIVGMDAGTRCPQFSRLNFDVSVLEHFCTFAAGGTLHLLPANLLGHELTRELRRREVTHLVPGPPALIESMVEEVPTLRSLAVAGEPCPPEVAARWSARCAMFNGYGPTEISIICTLHRFPPGVRETPPMGYAFAGARLHVLDADLRPVAAGCEGELHVGGPGVTRGYLGRPALTAERFLPDPFGAEPGARLYRTGDLCRRRADGTVDFVGRIDNQVKLRGFRIELGEVEAALGRHPGVERALALVREDVPGDRRLVAYVVRSGEGGGLTPLELKRFVKAIVPEFMVPAAVVFLPSFPLAPAGKVDRRALPAPGAAPPDAGPPPREEAPRAAGERAVAAIWREVLRLGAGERLGRDDNFFEAGGHSVLMAQVQTRLEAELGREIPLVELFRYPTVASLAGHLFPGEAGEAPPSPREVGLERARRRSAAGSSDVAIVGMACRVPGARNVEAFWANLVAGVESIRTFADDELAAAGVTEAEYRDPAYVRARGVLDEADRFDAAFFGYSPREAEILDPQQRVFLECAWEAFEDAGMVPGRVGEVGVFAGVGLNTYALALLPDPEVRDSVGSFQLSIANDKDFLATRVSYKLGLRGPSLGVQTACSTSLVAVHLACRSLLGGECDAALAGGVSIRLPQESGYLHRPGAVFSPDGHCRAFDAGAGGFVGGNGAGAVLLKRLEDALRDGDPIRAVIKGTAINNDGAAKAGFTAPGVEGQAAVIAQALAVAGVEGASIGYVEAHGTGTDLGDPIEVAALKAAFGEGAAPGSCALGSVKTNVGHLDSAAGVVGLIKAALVLERGAIPPSLHFSSPNPKLALAGSPFRVADRLTAWPRGEAGEAPRRAGVSSMGIGGTNAHAVLEEAPAVPAARERGSHQLLPLSARNDETLEGALDRLADFLEAGPGARLADVALTLQTGRKRFERRAFVVAEGAGEAAGAIRSRDPRSLAYGGSGAGEGEPPGVAFLFSGQGTQHPGMGRELYARGGDFRRWVDAGCAGLEPRLGFDLRTLLFPGDGDSGEAGSRLASTEVTQGALFVVEHALARQWMEWGVVPGVLLGHSIGELVAASLAGVFSFEDALTLVAARGAAMAGMPPGAMLAVSLAEGELLPLLLPGLSLAAVNAPRRAVVSGGGAEVEAFARLLAERGVPHRPLHTSHAFHSALMEGALAPFRRALEGVELRPPALPFVSNLTGTWITAEEATDPGYWVRHLRETVRFGDGVATLLAAGSGVLLEVGPGNSLTVLAKEGRGADEGAAGAAILASLPHPSDRRPDLPFLLATAGQLWLSGLELDWAALHEGEGARRIPLPAYPFERKRYWIEGAGSLAAPAGAGGAGDRLARREDVADWFHLPGWKRSVAAPPRGGEREGAAEGPGLFLLCAGDSALARQVGERLAAAGHEAVTVRAGERWERLSPASYRLRPDSRDDFAALLADLEARGEKVRGVLHAWSAGPAAGLEDALRHGYRSLLALAPLLARRPGGEKPGLLVVADGLFEVDGGERVEPAKATLLGALRVLPWELPGLRARLVELPAAPLPEHADRVLDELLLSGGGAPALALRGRHAWIPTWEPVRLEAGDPAAGGGAVREGGVYLVTGGFGGLGLEAAAALAAGRRVKLALLGRTALPPRESWGAIASGSEGAARSEELRALVARLLDLEAAGSEVLPLAADAADREALERALAAIEERFGALHGVVHAAGVAGGELIERKTAQATESAFRPRIGALEALASALAARVAAGRPPLDFLVLTGALGALFGEPGQADLCAASAYFDAFATACAGAAPPIAAAVCSIDWDTWREVGMAARVGGLPEELRRAREAALATAIRPAEGRRALLALLGRLGSRHAPLPQVAVSTRDLPALERRMAALARGEERGGEGGRARYARPELGSRFVPPRDEREEAVAAIWRELLGLERVGVDDNFFDLGGHSLLATQVAARVREAMGRELPIEALFEAPTVAGVAAYLGRGAGAAPAELSLDDLLSQIESMSPEEAAALLSEEVR